MENLRHFDKTVVDLGKKILAQFNDGEDRGILTSWMSHHIAALIDRAERERDMPAGKEALTECVDTILKLWSHRNALPNGYRPFERAERALQTLSTLAPEYPESFYFQRPSRSKVVPEQASLDADTWLRFAEDFDHAARIFIRLCLKESVSGSATELQDWVRRSEELGDDPAVDIELIRELIAEAIDDELEETARPEGKKNAKALAQLDSLIAGLTGIREAIARTNDTKPDQES